MFSSNRNAALKWSEGIGMAELSEDIKNSIFAWYFKITLVMSVAIVTPLSYVFYSLYEGEQAMAYVIFIILMSTIPISLIATNFTFKMIFPLKIRFKQKSLEVVHKNEARAFSIYYKDIESAIFYNDIMGVNACKFILREGKPKFVNQVGKEIIKKLKEVLDNYRISYETRKRGRQPDVG